MGPRHTGPLPPLGPREVALIMAQARAERQARDAAALAAAACPLKGATGIAAAAAMGAADLAHLGESVAVAAVVAVATAVAVVQLLPSPPILLYPDYRTTFPIHPPCRPPYPTLQ